MYEHRLQCYQRKCSAEFVARRDLTSLILFCSQHCALHMRVAEWVEGVRVLNERGRCASEMQLC